MRRATLLLLVAVASGGCFDFNPASGTLKCSSDPANPCPSGYACVSGLCWKNGELPGSDMGLGDMPAGAASLSVDQPMHDFGNVETGMQSAPITLTVTNQGQASTGMIATALAGTGAAAFSVDSDQCAAQTLAGGASCTITLHAAPTAAGSATATLAVSATPGGSATVMLSVTGVPPGSLPKAPTFVQPAARIDSGYGQTTGLTVADFSGDGKPDVATFNPAASGMGAGVVTTFVSNGTGGFNTPPLNGLGSGSTAVAIAAGLIGGTTMSVVTANADKQISEYGNNTSTPGQLDYRTNYTLGPSSLTYTKGTAMAMAPLDGGAKTWLVEGTDGGLIVVAPSSGSNFNVPGAAYLSGVSIVGIALGAFQGNLAPDIAAVGTDGSGAHAYVLLNNGSGTFGTPQTIAVTGTPAAVAAGDVNGGGVDLVVGTTNGIAIYLNTGTGGMLATTPAHTYSAPATVTGVAIADFNGDSKPDIAVSSNGADQVDVFTGNGDGTFNSPAVFGAGQVVYGIGVADFNGDSKPDIVVSGFYGIYLLLNTTN